MRAEPAYENDVHYLLNQPEIRALKGKDFLRTDHVNAKQTKILFDIAMMLKHMRRKHIELPKLLDQKTVALLFEKPSTRTRVSFDSGIHLLHGHSLFIDKATTQMGRGEDWRDTAMTLSQYTDAIMARVFEHKELEVMAKHADVPVVNGLTDEDHPCQILSDLFTMQEHFRDLKGLTVMYTGVSDNVTDSLMVGCAMMGANMWIASPKDFPVSRPYLKTAKKLAKHSGAEVKTFTEMPSPKELSRVNVVYTDEWESMHMHLNKKKLKPHLLKFQVNERLLEKCARGARAMHCLPAIKGEEVSPNIMYGKHSLVWTQAQNRMYVQMALLSALLKD